MSTAALHVPKANSATYSGRLNIAINGRFLIQKLTGVQRVAREVTLALDRLIDDGCSIELKVRIIVPGPKGLAAFEELGCRYITAEVANGASGHLWEQISLPRHVRDAKLLCLGNSAPMLSLFSGRPVAVMLHDQAHLLFPQDYSRGYRAFHLVSEAIILRRSAPLLLVSEAERAHLALEHPEIARRASVVPNGSWWGDQLANTPRARPIEDGYGLFIGNASERKNIHAVLAVAIRLARERKREFRFVGPAHAMLDANIPSDVRHLVRSEGYIEDAALPNLYGGAAFLLYPSLYEASGLPPSEAMTFGCPVVTSDLPVMHERCGNAALYCDPHDVDAIYATVIRLLDQPGMAHRMACAGLERAQHFTWRNQALAIISAMAAL